MDKYILQEMGRRYPRIGPTVIMTFAEEKLGIYALTHLNNLVDDGRMKVVFTHPHAVCAPICSGDWGGDQNRQVEARFPLGFALKDDFSLNVLASGGLESIKIVNQNPLNALMTRRQKLQQELAEKLINECLVWQVKYEAKDWGLTIEAGLDVDIKELPGIRFSFISDEDQTTVSSVLLDAWSGCIFVDGENPQIDRPYVYTGRDQVEQVLMETINTCIARLCNS